MFGQLQELAEAGQWRLPMEWICGELYMCILHELDNLDTFWFYVSEVYKRLYNENLDSIQDETTQAMFILLAMHLMCVHNNVDSHVLYEVLSFEFGFI